MVTDQKQNNSGNSKNIIIGVLLAALLGTGIWGFSNMKSSGTFEQKAENQEEQIDELGKLKDELTIKADSLNRILEAAVSENSTLKGSNEEQQQQIASLQSRLKKIKDSASGKDKKIGDLIAQIKELESIREELTFSIGKLTAENDSLRTETIRLTGEVETQKAANADLNSRNRALEDEKTVLTLATFKASAFKVDLERRKEGKATVKSRRARRVNISFDLTNVPKKYQGVRPIYMVISDDKGTPIKAANPVKAQVMVDGQPVDIIAVSVKDVDLTDTQRLSFNHELEDRLSKGLYTVRIYSDIGLLGSQSFQLQ